MSLEIDGNNSVNRAGNKSGADNTEVFEFKQVQIGSIFLKDNGDGKVSVNDFNHTTGKLAEFLAQYTNSAENWTKDIYTNVVNYLNKNKDEIKNDSINEVVSSFQAKAADKSQVAGTATDGDWVVTQFKDGTFMKENKAENKIRYYDSQGRWVAGTNNKGARYLNTYVNENENSEYSYISEEEGSDIVFYYNKNDILLFTEDEIERATYIAGDNGKLKHIEVRDIKTNKLTMIAYADENENIKAVEKF